MKQLIMWNLVSILVITILVLEEMAASPTTGNSRDVKLRNPMYALLQTNGRR